jgi:hypothetical protein
MLFLFDLLFKTVNTAVKVPEVKPEAEKDN